MYKCIYIYYILYLELYLIFVSKMAAERYQAAMEEAMLVYKSIYMCLFIKLLVNIKKKRVVFVFFFMYHV